MNRDDHAYARRMADLVLAFPCLRRLLGREVITWDPDMLAERYMLASSGERAAIAFVLSVWNMAPDAWRDYGIPTFNLSHFASMDEVNQVVVASWFTGPFYP